MVKNGVNANTITDGHGRSMLGVTDLAERWGCSTRHVRRLADSGRIPRPIKLGSLLRWSANQIESWEADGCPNVRKAAKGGEK